MSMQPITLNPTGSFAPASVTIPKHVVQQRVRAPKKNIPQTVVERTHILNTVRRYVAEFNPIPPMPSDELKVHADRLVEMLKCDAIYRDYIGVLLNNEMWRESVAAVPFERPGLPIVGSGFNSNRKSIIPGLVGRCWTAARK